MVNSQKIEEILVAAIVFFIPFGGISIETGIVSLSIPNLLIIFTIMYLFCIYVYQETHFSKPQLAILSLFCIGFVLITVSSLVRGGSPRWISTYLGFIFITTIFYVHINSISDIRRLLLVAFLSAIVVSILTIIHSVLYPVGHPLGGRYFGRRTLIGFTIPFQRTIGVRGLGFSGFGMMLMIGTPYYFYKSIRKRNIIFLLGVGVVLFGVFVSQSRSAWVATGLAMITVIIGHLIGGPEEECRLTLLVFVLFSAALMGPYLIQLIIMVQPETLYVRIEQYKIALNIMGTYPMFGIGIGNVDQVYSRYGIHNAFLRIGARAGFLVFSLVIIKWTLSVLFLIRGIYSSTARYVLTIGLLASLAAVAIQANMHVGFSKSYWVVLAIAVSLYSIR